MCQIISRGLLIASLSFYLLYTICIPHVQLGDIGEFGSIISL